METKTYHIITNQETFLIEGYGIAELKTKVYHHMQACYGNDYNILDIIDVSNRNIIDKEKYLITL